MLQCKSSTKINLKALIGGQTAIQELAFLHKIPRNNISTPIHPR